MTWPIHVIVILYIHAMVLPLIMHTSETVMLEHKQHYAEPLEGDNIRPENSLSRRKRKYFLHLFTKLGLSLNSQTQFVHFKGIVSNSGSRKPFIRTNT